MMGTSEPPDRPPQPPDRPPQPPAEDRQPPDHPPQPSQPPAEDPQPPAQDQQAAQPQQEGQVPTGPEAASRRQPPGRTTGLQDRRVRRGAASGVYALAVVAILVVANAFGAQFYRTWDLTASHRYTLTRATVTILNHLKRPVELLAFLQPGSSSGSQIKQLLSEYRAQGSGRVTYRVVDPAAHPATARSYGVSQYDTVVVVSGTSTALVTPQQIYSYSGAQTPAVFQGEQAVTNGILRAANPQHLAVYFVTGHGEQSITGGYSSAAGALTSQGYTVHTVNLLAAGTVPKGAAAVIIAGPRQDLAPQEIQTLSRYADGGGHVLVLLDPTAGPLPAHLVALLRQWGVGVEHDVVVDPAANHHAQFSPSALIPSYGSSPITAPLASGHLPSVLPGALSVRPEARAPYQTTALLQTSPQGWGKTNLKNNTLTFTTGDLKGPLDLGLAVTSPGAHGPQASFRAVIIGSSFFASNQFLNVQGNQDLFLNAVGWLTGRSQGITIRPPAAGSLNQVFISGGTASRLFFGLVVLLPLLCFGGAAAVWSMRRRL